LLLTIGSCAVEAIGIDNDLRGTLRNFGLKVEMVGTVKSRDRSGSWSTAVREIAPRRIA